MKIALSIYNLKTLKEAVKTVDFAVLMVPKYAQIYEDDFDIDEAIIYCKENNIEPILSITRIFMEDELDEIKSFVKKYKCKFLVSDLGVAQIFKELGRTQDVIFDSPTMICNSLDLETYSTFGFDALSMSNEITINDLINSYKKTNAPIYYQIFGRKVMFYSKRKLLSCYEKHTNKKLDKTNLSIKEEKRTELMPVVENENGFYVFRSYYLSYLKQLQDLSFLKYGYIETLTLTAEQINRVLSVIFGILDGKNPEDGINELESLGLLMSDGFANNDSIHVKEKIINEKN